MKYKFHMLRIQRRKGKESYMFLLSNGKEENIIKRQRRKKTIRNCIAMLGSSPYNKGIKQMTTKLNMGYF